MNSDPITVGTVSYYSTKHLAALFKNLQDMVCGSDLRFVVCDNTNGQDSELYDTLGEVCEIVPFVPEYPSVRGLERRRASVAHGLGLNMLLSRASTESCLFVDPDCLVLTRGWDLVCKAAITDSCIAVGAPHHSRKISKYHDFPSPIFVFFNTDAFRIINADWTAYSDSLATEIWDQVMRVFAIGGAVLGERIVGRGFYASRAAVWMRRFFGNSSKDTGWRIPQRARARGYSTVLFPTAVAPWQLHPKLAEEPAITSLMDEFELHLCHKIPLITHFYGSRHRKKYGRSRWTAEDVRRATNRWRSLSASVADICASVDAASILMSAADAGISGSQAGSPA